MFIMERLCREVTMECFSDGTVGDMSLSLWPTSACTPTFPITHLVKKVVVVVCTGPSADDPRAKHLINRPSQPSFFFPNAIALKVVLPDYRDSLSVGANLSELGASEFAQDIKWMVPAVRGVAIHSIDPHYADGYGMSNDHLLGRFSIDLCQSMSQVSIKWPCDVQQYDVGSEWEDGLTDRKYEDSQRDHRAFFELIRRNAGTLLSLKVRLKDDQKISDLCSDNSGRAIVYPLLKKLIIRDHRDSYFSSMSDADETVAFPMLKYLSACDYFDHADHAFKGISSTLEYLSLGLSIDSVIRLEQSGIFTVSKLPLLRHMKLYNWIKDAAVELPEAEATRFAIKILDAAQFVHTLMLFGNFDKGTFLSGIQAEAPWTSSIQSLTFADHLVFKDILHLLKHLPALQKLCCWVEESATVDSDYDDYFGEPVDVIYRNNYSLSKCFTSCYYTDGPGYNPTYIAWAVAMLTILCPNFIHAFVDNQIAEDIMSESKRLDVCEQFERHCRRLEQVKVYELGNGY